MENSYIYKYHFSFPESCTDEERGILLRELGGLIDQEIRSTEKFQICFTENGFQVFRKMGYARDFNAHVYHLGKHLISELTLNDTAHENMGDYTHPDKLTQVIKDRARGIVADYLVKNQCTLESLFLSSKIHKSFEGTRREIWNKGMYEKSHLDAHVDTFLDGLNNPILLFWLWYMLDRYIAQPRGMRFDFEYLYTCLHTFQHIDSYCDHPRVINGQIVSNFSLLLKAETAELINYQLQKNEPTDACPMLLHKKLERNLVMKGLLEYVGKMMHYFFENSEAEIQSFFIYDEEQRMQLNDEVGIYDEVKTLGEFFHDNPNLALFYGVALDPESGEFLGPHLVLENNPFFKQRLTGGSTAKGAGFKIEDVEFL